ncbi:Kinesin [Pleurostoma richardsiae]|uniref:Kinesin n=1 Tax=Pleurostoma richardsiae TaxID=41990 RepID=A0AA38REU3_9PEZI|nr:Kinesin [Pleurostoma richardsiae]
MVAMDPGASSISVAVRVRPFTIREAAQLVRNDDGTVFLGDGSLAAAPAPKLKQSGIRSVIKVVDDRCLVFDPPEDNPVQKFSRSVVPNGKKVKDQVFAFDRIFDDNATQTDVYEGTTKKLLDSVLDGYNATVFAYGATGCGKTHTITGTSQQPGIIFLTMQELFEKIHERSEEKVTEISLSYLEIYNETIRDLLVPGGSKQGLMLREDSHQAVTVAGLTSHHPKDVQEVMDMIVQGNEYRTVSPTEANATSSRSHAVLQINVAQKDRNADVNEPHTMATLSIIDLAGSERASATKNRGERLLEGANINKSLLALGSCINALCDPRKKNHVPYRNSKLTRLLKFSLGGNCKTVMIVCVSPSSAHFDETQNTLRYANRAKNIQTKVTRNVFNVNRHVKDFLVKIDEQMALINELKAQQKDAENVFFAKFRKNLERREAVAREGIQRIRVAYENSTPERQEKIATMKKLKAFERRIALLSAWLASFDALCEAREDEDAMPPNLVAMRKTAQGILAELENSRHHLHQKLEKSNWERAIDTALQHSISQLPSGDGNTDCGEVATLARETELLKSNFMREAYQQTLEQEKAGDASVMQVLLTAQFEIIAAMSDTLAMDEEEAITHAKDIIHRLLETGYAAASHVIKPDGSMPRVEIFPPSKRGTPKRKKMVNIQARPVAAPALASFSSVQQQNLVSPMKSSPRRRKVMNARKGVSFTPVKKKSPSKRMVRWRDDETEEGTLADFEKTPQKSQPTPEYSSLEKSEASIELPAAPSYLQPSEETSDSSPSLIMPEVTSISAAKPNRFQAGFLSKARASRDNGSPVPEAPTLSLNLANSSDSEDRPTPLKSLDIGRTANHLTPPPSTFGRSPKQAATSPDENNPPTATARRSPSASASASDSDSSSLIDTKNLRSALNSVKRRERLSSMGGTAASNAKRTSTSSQSSGPVAHHRASNSYSGPLASSTNGISRQRRRSADRTERRRSPPMSCSPTSDGRALTAGQARRMNMGGSLRVEGAVSPRGLGDRGRDDGKTRRITIGGPGMAALAGAPARPAPRPSVAWR